MSILRFKLQQIPMTFVLILLCSSAVFAAWPKEYEETDLIGETHVTGDLYWHVAEDGNAVIHGFNENSTATTLTIPAKLEGHKVAAIGYIEYYDYEGGGFAYNGLDLEVYDEAKDDYVAKVNKIVVEEGNEYFTSVDGVLFSKDKSVLYLYPAGKTATSYIVPSTVKYIYHCAFGDSEKFTSITLPSGLLEIGMEAFEDCWNLTSLTLPDSVTKLWKSAFEETGLKSIKLPKGLKEIGGGIFEDCDFLSSISVASGNQYFCAVSDVLFSYDKKTLYAYPVAKSGKSYTVPSGTEIIAEDAFNETKLNTVTLPSTLKRIEKTAFYGSSLTGITIPASVTYIGYYAFRECEDLTKSKVKFEGEIPEGADDAFDFDVMDYSPASNFKYEKSDWLVCITTYTGKENCVRIPKTIDNCMVYSISSEAFADATTVTEIVIPEYVKECQDLVCPNLKKISVSSKNYSLKSVDGVLVDRNTDTLLCYPSAKEGTSYTIPEEITTLGQYSFSEVKKLTELIIPSSVIEAENSSVVDCEALTTVRIEKNTIDDFDEWCFNCPNITAVYFPNGLPEATLIFGNSYPTIYVDDFGEEGTYWGDYPVVYTRVPTPTALAIDGPNSGKSGDEIQLTAIATFEDGKKKEVEGTWSITSGASYGKIAKDGVLTIGNFDGQKSITVKAVYTANDKNFNATKTITACGIAEEPLVLASDSYVTSSSSTDLKVNLVYSDGSSVEIVPEWSLVSGENVAHISSTGKLSVSEVKKNTPITVRATYKVGDKSYTQDFTIDAQPQVFNDSRMQYTYILKPGWQIVAVVLNIDEESEKALLALKPYSIDENHGRYQLMTDIQGGQSCWIHVDEETPITVKGTPMGTLLTE